MNSEDKAMVIIVIGSVLFTIAIALIEKL